MRGPARPQPHGHCRSSLAGVTVLLGSLPERTEGVLLPAPLRKLNLAGRVSERMGLLGPVQPSREKGVGEEGADVRIQQRPGPPPSPPH